MSDPNAFAEKLEALLALLDQVHERLGSAAELPKDSPKDSLTTGNEREASPELSAMMQRLEQLEQSNKERQRTSLMDSLNVPNVIRALLPDDPDQLAQFVETDDYKAIVTAMVPPAKPKGTNPEKGKDVTTEVKAPTSFAEISQDSSFMAELGKAFTGLN